MNDIAKRYFINFLPKQNVKMYQMDLIEKMFKILFGWFCNKQISFCMVLNFLTMRASQIQEK